MKVYFVRHGESIDNAATKEKDRLGGPGDALTDEGWEQARRLGKRLRNEPITRILASPMRRTQETAAAIAETLDVPIIYFPPVHEVVRFRDQRYLSKTPQAYEKAFIAHWKRMGTVGPDERVDDGDTFNEVLGRIKDTFAEFEKLPARETPLVATHGDFLRFTLGHLTRRERFQPADASGFVLGAKAANTGISEIVKTDIGWRLVTWMDQSHL
jgi:broad specificity phosphatase PhoE